MKLGEFRFKCSCPGSDGDERAALSIGREYWGACHAHKRRWLIGSVFCSTWRDEDEDEQLFEEKELFLGTRAEIVAQYQIVDPNVALSAEARGFRQASCPGEIGGCAGDCWECERDRFVRSDRALQTLEQWYAL